MAMPAAPTASKCTLIWSAPLRVDRMGDDRWRRPGAGLMPLLYPLVAGLTLLGPVVALGLYENSHPGCMPLAYCGPVWLCP